MVKRKNEKLGSRIVSANDQSALIMRRLAEAVRGEIKGDIDLDEVLMVLAESVVATDVAKTIAHHLCKPKSGVPKLAVQTQVDLKDLLKPRDLPIEQLQPYDVWANPRVPNHHLWMVKAPMSFSVAYGLFLTGQRCISHATLRELLALRICLAQPQLAGLTRIVVAGHLGTPAQYSAPELLVMNEDGHIETVYGANRFDPKRTGFLMQQKPVTA